MTRKLPILFAAVLLIASVCFAGCSVNIGSPAPTAAATAAPTMVETPPPATIAVATTVMVTTTVAPTTAATTAPAEKVILHETGSLTTKTYKTYDFKTQMGYKFLYPKDKFRITIKSQQPVLGYAISSEKVGQLPALIPRYQSFVKGGIDWGLLEPKMVIEKATDTTKEFTLDDVGSLAYVVDGRWMGYENVYDNTGPFTFEITIVKTGGPTQQSFDFTGYESSTFVTSKTPDVGE